MKHEIREKVGCLNKSYIRTCYLGSMFFFSWWGFKIQSGSYCFCMFLWFSVLWILNSAISTEWKRNPQNFFWDADFETWKTNAFWGVDFTSPQLSRGFASEDLANLCLPYHLGEFGKVVWPLRSQILPCETWVPSFFAKILHLKGGLSTYGWRCQWHRRRRGE